MRIRLAAAAGLLLLTCCREQKPPEISAGRMVRAEGALERSLVTLAPDHCRAGEVFGRLPGGESELILTGTGLTRNDAVFWNGRPLRTYFASSRTLSAAVPPEVLQTPGSVEVTVGDPMDPARPRLRATFVVRTRA
jgi:hypothetical protein